MSFVVLILLVAIGTGFLFGGSLRRLETVRLHWWGAALLGLAVQGLVSPSGVWSARLVALAAYGLLLAFVVINRRLPGAFLMAIGLVVNLAVMLPSGSMPVSGTAIRLAGGHDLTIADPRHHLATQGEVLTPLGDAIPLPEPIGVVVSLGDLMIYAGVALLVVAVMRGRFDENLRAPSRWFQMYRGKHEAVPRVRRQTLLGVGPAGARWGTAR
jgi:hypothetical protein